MNQKSVLSYFHSSFIFTFGAIVTGFAYGMYITGNISATLSMVMLIGVLGVLEVSVSFDNAIVNAGILKDMDEVWQKRFITWGIAIAVFGMRIVFPVIIVSVVGNMGIFEAISTAFSDPEKYAHILHESKVQVAGFGGTFLLLVAFGFFFNAEKDVHWVSVIEKQLVKLGSLRSVEVMFTIIIVLIFSYNLETSNQLKFLISSLFGIITHELVKAFGDYMQSKQEERTSHVDATMVVAKNGLASFLYLEVLDASFSFDGVIASFAITRDIVIIALGLGIGAMFVRSLTIMFVKKNTLTNFTYLEHGAFWSILSLAFIMFITTKHEIPEVVTGGIAAVLILSSLFWSIIKKSSEEVFE